MRARHKEVMEHIEQDLDSMKGNVDEVKGSVEQVMSALINLIVR